MRYSGTNEDPSKERGGEPTVFGLNMKGIRQKQRRRSPAEERAGAQAGAANRMDPLKMAVCMAERREKEEREARAMHGPVKVLWKDGEPV